MSYTEVFMDSAHYCKYKLQLWYFRVNLNEIILIFLPAPGHFEKYCISQHVRHTFFPEKLKKKIA